MNKEVGGDNTTPKMKAVGLFSLPVAHCFPVVAYSKAMLPTSLVSTSMFEYPYVIAHCLTYFIHCVVIFGKQKHKNQLKIIHGLYCKQWYEQ